MYELTHAERAHIPVALACRVLEVSRSGYYAWRDRGRSKRSKEDRQLRAEIRGIYKEHRARYGSPRIHRELVERGFSVGLHRVARLMAEDSLQGRQKRRFRTTTDSTHALRVAPNVLARDFTAKAPNEKWVGDITYIRTLDGWLYLAALIDLFSRRVVGFATSSNIDTELALDALTNALRDRHPPAELVHHTDRDSRYCSHSYQKTIEDRHLMPSMSRKGNCWDNAVAESFFATLEKELLLDRPLTSTEQTRAQVIEYIEVYYNAQRRHSSIDYMSPIQFQMSFTTKKRDKGTGLGVALCADIVRQHKGSIEVRSRPGLGATFSLGLPVDNGLEPSRVELAAPSRGGRSPTMRSGRLLFVDDELMLIRAYKRSLAKHYDVVFAEGGQQALDALAEDDAFDLVVCDLMMPQVDGIRVFEHARAHHPHLVDRFLFCSGGAFTPRAREFIASNGNRLIEKPVSPRELDAGIQQALAEVQGTMDASGEEDEFPPFEESASATRSLT